MKSVVAVIGPTAIGKSELALALAEEFSGEIVSADSRQVYRHMDIGTAKPGPQQRSRVNHHLIDLIDPDQDFSLALYQKLAFQAIENCLGRGHLPLLVGGSGLYVWSVLEGWKIPQVPPDHSLRHSLEQRAKSEGGLSLYKELQVIDPEAARQIDWRNWRRVIRALEVCQTTGVPFSQMQNKQTPDFNTIIIGLTTSREDLYRRIDLRIDKMIEQGLVAEVKGLLDRGYGLDFPAMSSLGYQQIGQFLYGKLTLDDAVQQIKYETHRFARHQYAWFRANDKRIHWFDVRQDFMAQATKLVKDFALRTERIKV
jgi:tRNA dimethylallyltransferase